MPEIDPEFLALPMRRLADAALSRARELGVAARRLPAGADPQPGSDARATAGSTRPADGEDARLRGPGGARGHLGLRRRRRPDPGGRGRGSPSRRSRWPRCPARSTPSRRAGRRAGARRRHLGLAVRGRPVRGARRGQDRRCSPSGPSGCWPPTASTTCEAVAAAGAGEQVLRRPRRHVTTQQRVRMHPELTATAVDRSRGTFEHDAHPRPAGRPRLGVPDRRHLGLGRRAGPDPGVAGREGEGAVRRARAGTTWSSTRPTSG